MSLALPPNALGMGCWQLGGASRFGGRTNGYGQVSEQEAIATVRSAFEAGIRFFDTSDAYGHGRSEQFLAKGLGADRKQAIICTKFGAREDGNGSAYHDFSNAHLDRAIHASLARLGTDRIDILLLHGPPDDMDWGSFDRSGLDAAVSDGRIGAYGVSVRSVHGARNVVAKGFGSYVETVINALDRRATELHERANANGQRLIARVPLASGFLTSSTLAGSRTFADDDIRNTFPLEQVQWVTDAVRSLSFLDELPGGLAVSALRFIIFHPAVHVTIPGMRTPSQVEMNTRARDLGPLSPDLCTRVEAAVPEVFHGWR